jgi:hypothetical protein
VTLGELLDLHVLKLDELAYYLLSPPQPIVGRRIQAQPSTVSVDRNTVFETIRSERCGGVLTKTGEHTLHVLVRLESDRQPPIVMLRARHRRTVRHAQAMSATPLVPFPDEER